LIEYANQHYIILDLNEKRNNGSNPLMLAICYNKNNTEIVKLLIEYANKHNIILELNEKNSCGICPLLFAISYSEISVEMVKVLLEYANEQHITLELNEKDGIWGDYPLLKSIEINSIEIIKLLIEYANQHQLVLELNEKNNNGICPLLRAIDRNHIEIIKMLIEYADQHQITLELNEKNKKGDSPFLKAISNNNIEIVNLLIEYADQHQINLEYNENEIAGNSIIIELIQNYEREKEMQERMERERIENERLERERIENERIENERLERERSERERIERERLENERIERERIERERFEKERLEKERLEKREELEMERLEIERSEIERIERERLEMERLILNNNYQEREMEKKKKKNNNDNILNKTPTLVIATNNFDGGERYDHLDIKKGEFLIVTDWNCAEKGWVYGYRKNNKEEKGIFPEVFIKIYKDENIENSALKNKITPEYKIRFENKINQLRSLNEMKILDSTTLIQVNRNNLFSNAYNGIMGKSPEELKKRLKVKYIDEEGIDAGGLLRDFFYQMSKEIGNPDYSLFKYSHDNSYELEINPLSSIVDPNYLQYYRFIGRVIGLAIFNKQYLSVSFVLLLYKRLLNKPLEFSDLEYVDPQLFKNLKQLRDNDGAEYLYLTFSMDTVDCFGNHKTIELKPNGSNIDVTDFNKNEYIDLIVKNKLNKADDKEQLNALKQGFYEILPHNINSFLDGTDLKFLISGINMIDVDDWENNTDYEGYKKDDITIINFWECVRKFSNENRTKLLLFATGNSQVPVTGFKDLQGSGKIQHFKLKKIGTDNDLPKSHTCFNRIDLPPYTSLTIMRQKLLLAISEGMGGFSME